jgi:hypothetical protein
LHEDFALFDFNVMRASCFGCRHRKSIAGSKVKLRSMARAADAIAVHFSFTERPTVVRADVVNAVDFAVYQGHEHKPIVYFERGWNVWLQIG